MMSVLRVMSVVFALVMVVVYAVVVQKKAQRASAALHASTSPAPLRASASPATLASSSKSLVMVSPARFSDITSDSPQPTPAPVLTTETTIASTKWAPINSRVIINATPQPPSTPVVSATPAPTRPPVVAPGSKSWPVNQIPLVP